MTIPDFEISARLRAHDLESHTRPDVETSPEGERVVMTRRGRRTGLPDEIEPGGRYAEVEVETSIRGWLVDDDALA